ncbi:hypothetical protein ACHAXH_000218 [Discostella pseudostelligera]
MMTSILNYQDSLLSISAFLSVHDVRRLASTCRSIRGTLLRSEAATKQIWVNRLIESFPAVCGTINEPLDTVTRRITFKVDYQRAISRLPCGDGIDLNFPLIVSLLPKRHPQSIDIGPQSFQTFKAKMSQVKVDDNDVKNRNDDSIYTLIQFSGKVGTGNRSIRSDMPFPPNCREGALNYWSDGGGACFRRHKSASSVYLPDSPVRSKCMSPSTAASSSLSDDYCLDCFLSYGPFSLDETTMISTKSGSNNELVDTNHTLSLTVRQRLSRCFSEAGKIKKYPIPFIIPTVISESRAADGKRYNDLLVDLTPRLIMYFEVTLMKPAQHAMTPEQTRQEQRHDCVAVGLSTSSFQPQHSMPGWDDKSYGYHSDDGGMFHGKGVAARRGNPTFGPGDTIGCGLDYASRKIFFTKNAEFIGYEFARLRRHVLEKGLYPTVGIDSNCPIFVNFGAHPFTFNLKDFQNCADQLSMLKEVAIR